MEDEGHGQRRDRKDGREEAGMKVEKKKEKTATEARNGERERMVSQ